MENLLIQLNNILITSKSYYSIHIAEDVHGKYIVIYCQCSEQPIVDFCQNLDVELKILPFKENDEEAVIGIRPKGYMNAETNSQTQENPMNPGRPPHKTSRYFYYASHAHLTKTQMAQELGIERRHVSSEIWRYQLPCVEEPRGINEAGAELIRHNFRKIRYPLLAKLVGCSLMTIKRFVCDNHLYKTPNNRRKWTQK